MYDQPVSTTTVTAALQNSTNPAFDDQTILNEIVTLTTSSTGGTADTTVVITEVTVTGTTAPTIASGTELALVTVNKVEGQTTPVVFTANAVKNVPVLVLQGNADVEVTLNDGATQGAADVSTTAVGATVPATGAQRVVVAGSGNSKFTISDTKNTKLTLGTGNSTVVTGQGVDTVVAGLGNSTISAGNGNDFSVVKLNGNASNYTVSASAGHAIVTDKTTGVKTDISKIQFVEVNNGDALIFAKSTTEASIATLFEVAYGRNADAAGLDYYFDLAKDGATLKQIAQAFVNAPEFATRNLLDDRSFINSLYMNTFGRAGEEAGINYWLGAIQNHAATRADLIQSFASIHTAYGQGAKSPAGTVEAILVGNVTVVSDII